MKCPWRKTADEMTRARIDFPTMIARYIPEVKRLTQQQSESGTDPKIQVAGPHVPSITLGDWSAGGILALEASGNYVKAGIRLSSATSVYLILQILLLAWLSS